MTGDPFDEPVDHPLLGRCVKVTLARKGDCPGGHQHEFDDPDATHCLPLTEDEYIIGTLVRLDAGGSFDIRDDDGKMRYCWPALDITEALGRVPRHCPCCGEPGPGLVNGEAYCKRCTWTATIQPREKL